MYNDEAYTEEKGGMFSYIPDGQILEYKVEEGKTYYCYTDFTWNGGTFKLYYEDELKRIKTAPAENSVLNITGKGYLELHYSLCVSVESVTLAVNGKTLAQSEASANGRIVGVRFKGENSNEFDIKALIANGVLQEGDELAFCLKVTSVLNPSLTLDETVKYVCPAMPVTLVSDNSDSFVFKSYWNPGDDAGKLILTFDDELWTPTAENKGAKVSIGYGDVEAEDPNEYYHEEFYPIIDGNRLICDFTQKRRTTKDMVVSGKNYGTILVKVVGVLDKNGNYVSSDGKGTIGTWSWNFPYEELNSRITYEFSPKNEFTSDDTTIELWIGGYSDIHMNSDGGVLFSWTDKSGFDQSVKIVVNDLDIVVEDGDATIRITVPDAVRDSKSFNVALVGYTVTDGVSHPIETEYQYIDKSEDPVDPSEPEDPVDPSEPEDPVDPSEPEDPVGPSEPEDPVDPSEPEDPVDPSEPEETSIGDVESTGVVAVKFYNLNGVEVRTLVKGVNIIKKTLTDGTEHTSKVLVK